MKTKVIFVLFAFLLSGSLIAADRSHNSKDPCKQIADKQRQKACKEKYLAFQLCRHNYRKCNFGTLGDSLTDEYQGHSNLAGLNWVEQIVETRGLDFGRFEENPEVRGEPRNDGYSHNYARWGASATEPTWPEVIPWCAPGNPCEGKSHLFQAIPHFSVQLEGLSAKVAAGKVQVVTIGLGANDIFIYRTLGGTFIGDSLLRWDEISGNIIAGIANAVDVLQAAGPVMIVAARVPVMASWGEAAAAAINQTNIELAAALAAREVPLIDAFGFLNDPKRLRFTSSGVDLMLGDYAMPIVPWSVARKSDLVEPDDPRAIGPCRIVGPEWFDPVATSELRCGTLEYQLNAVLDDGIHPSTLAMGLMANEFVKAFRSTYGLKIRPLSTEEILDAAGIVELEEEHCCDR
jgi:lysophospholipase L1-like esterase